MTIKRAVEHYIWKLKNVGKPTQKDVDALNTIMQFVENKHKQQINDYDLFVKLYIFVYQEFLNNHNTTVFNSVPQKELNKLLDRPIEDFINDFTKSQNDIEQRLYFKELGISEKHPALKDLEEKEKDLNKLKGFDKDRLFGNVWKYNDIKEQLINQINSAIDLCLKKSHQKT